MPNGTEEKKMPDGTEERLHYAAKNGSEKRCQLNHEGIISLYKRYLELKKIIPYDTNIAKRLNMSSNTLAFRIRLAKKLGKKITKEEE